jgi:hypothetical protein
MTYAIIGEGLMGATLARLSPPRTFPSSSPTRAAPKRSTNSPQGSGHASRLCRLSVLHRTFRAEQQGLQRVCSTYSRRATSDSTDSGRCSRDCHARNSPQGGFYLCHRRGQVPARGPKQSRYGIVMSGLSDRRETRSHTPSLIAQGLNPLLPRRPTVLDVHEPIHGDVGSGRPIGNFFSSGSRIGARHESDRQRQASLRSPVNLLSSPLGRPGPGLVPFSKRPRLPRFAVSDVLTHRSRSNAYLAALSRQRDLG